LSGMIRREPREDAEGFVEGQKHQQNNRRRGRRRYKRRSAGFST
jgi:hypothetical protein